MKDNEISLDYHKNLEIAKKQVFSMLEAKHNNVTPNSRQIKEAVEVVINFLNFENLTVGELTRSIEENKDFSIDMTEPPSREEGSLENNWLGEKSMRFLDRYMLLLDKDGWSADSINNQRTATRDILLRCGNPQVKEPWSYRGMVIGEVQSGKTTSFISLICAAIDAGYKNIIVLAGRTNDLRHQTQERVDIGVIGKESTPNPTGSGTKIGVGLLKKLKTKEAIILLTSQDYRSGDKMISGDFKASKTSHNNVSGPCICIAVIKKHAGIIDNLTEWLAENGRLSGNPLLLIDDEADDASIDTNNAQPDENPTAINSAIRKLLKDMYQSTYIAYTATPYANIMINPEATGNNHGNDLFPSDFIGLLTPPPHYFGARRFLDEDLEYPRTVSISDTEAWIKGQKTINENLPKSLSHAIIEFILVSAIRRSRSNDIQKPRQHESMLIHASIGTAVHSQIQEQVDNEVEKLKGLWLYPVPEHNTPQEILDVWDELKIRQEPKLAKSWHEILPYISEVFESLKVVSINGQTQEKLDYRRSENKSLTVIAIGGHKLSRGLTLEGLTTSYHSRNSDQYDTLMQMCRWFGYRTGYEDLCRLYAPSELLRKFRVVMESDMELREELRDMTTREATPREFGLRVRSSPGMRITGNNKLQNALEVKNALAGRTLEVTEIRANDSKHNEQLMKQLVTKLGEPRIRKEKRVWDDVSWDTIAPFLEQFYERTDPLKKLDLKGKIQRSLSYIKDAQSANPPRLKIWTIALASKQSGEDIESDDYAGYPIYRVTRTSKEEDDLIFGAISDPADELLAMDDLEGKRRSDIKKQRPREKGLLIIYPIRVLNRDKKHTINTTSLAISFPEDYEMRKHIYVLNTVAQKEVSS